MDASLLSFRKLYSVVNNSTTPDINQICLLFSTLVYFGDEFIIKIASKLGVKSIDIREVNGLKFLYVTYRDNTFVAFRGTEFSKWSNLKRIFNFLPKRNPNGRKSHRGFVMALADLKKLLGPLIFNPKSVIFTGHSLGGAIAILAAEYYEGVAVTFASPKVYFNENIKNKISYVGYRIAGDPVPFLPPSTLFMEWCRPIPQFMWRYRKRYFNITKYHHVSVYIEHILGIINAGNKA